MAGSFNSHKHKKFNRYTASPTARKRRFPPYLIILFSALAAVIFAVFLGNYLGKLADEIKKPDEPTVDIEPPKELPSLLDAETIMGDLVTLEGILDNTAQNVRAQVPEGSEAVSLILFDGNGDPYYRSHVAEAFGNKCGELTLTRVFEGITINERMLYSSVVFPSKALNNVDSARQAVLNAYEAAIIEELSEAGACDVILAPLEFGDIGFVIDDAFIERLEDYVKFVRVLSPSIRIGLAVPLVYASDNGYSAFIEELSKRVDFLALDLTDKNEVEGFSDAISDASLNILRREMRLLLADTGDGTIEERKALLDKYSMSNYQTVKKIG